MHTLLVSLGLLILSSPAFASRGDCGSEIVFNCDEHTVDIDGVKTPIDCGAATRPKAGIIGQPGRAAGSRYPSMKGAPMVTAIPPFSYPGGNVVFHLIPPKGDRCPIGHNRGAGCIHVCPNVLTKLGRCYGTPYRVLFSRYGKAQVTKQWMQSRTRFANADHPTAAHVQRRDGLTGWQRFWRALFGGGLSGGTPASTNSNATGR